MGPGREHNVYRPKERSGGNGGGIIRTPDSKGVSAVPHTYSIGDLVHVKASNGDHDGQPSNDAKGKFGEILGRYITGGVNPTGGTPVEVEESLPMWWVAIEIGDTEPIGESWLEPEADA